MIVPHGLRWFERAEIIVVVGSVGLLRRRLREQPSPRAWVFVDSTVDPVRYYFIPPERSKNFLIYDTDDHLSRGLSFAAIESTRSLQPHDRPVVVVGSGDGEVLGAWWEPRRHVWEIGLGDDEERDVYGYSGEYPFRPLGPPTGPPPAGPPPTQHPPRRKPPAEERREPSEVPPTIEVHRTPHLTVPTLPTAPGSEFSVSVYIDDRAFDAGESGRALVITTPTDELQVELQVILLVSDHFVVDGSPAQRQTVDLSRSRSRALTFDLRVADDPPSDPRATISALFSHQGRASGEVRREWTWDPRLATATPKEVIPSQDGSTPEPLVLYPGTTAIDLTVEIRSQGDGLHFLCAAYSRFGLNTVRLEPYGLPESAPAMVSRKLSALRNPHSEPAERLDALRRAGYEFWFAAPQCFRDLYWSLVDAGHPVRTIAVVSEEPTLPWELMIPTRSEGSPTEHPPLGVNCAIGRWCRRRQRDGSMSSRPSPPPTISLRDAVIIAPTYRDLPRLDAAAEIKALRRLAAGRRMRRATRAGFDSYFRRQATSALHFVCHGDAGIEDDDVIYLDQDEQMVSASVRSNEGLKAMCRRTGPLVFINACSTGALVPGLSGGAGFPLAFGDVGARAVIAPLWPVDSTVAADVAVTVYERTLGPEGQPVAEVLRELRARAYAEGGADSYAAYAFFGDPHATLVLER